MKPECEAAIRAVAGGAKMTQKDIDGIQARILGSLRSLARTDPKAWASMSTAERMTEAARIAKERYVADTAQAHIRSVQRLAIKTRNDARVTAVAPGANGRIAYMIRNLFHSGEENGGDTSLEKEIMATSGMYLRHLEGEHMLAMQDPTLQDALWKELAGEDSGNAQAKATAKAVREQMAAAYKAQQAAGIAGPGLENYMPQARDWTRMNDVDEWVRKQFDRLRLDAFVNPDGTNMSREQIEKFLRESFATLATNGLNKLDGNGHVADIGSRGPRQLFYKDGASLKAEMDDYGRGSSVAEIVQSHFHRAARDLATATREGHMADTDVLDRARKAASDDMLAAKSAKEKRKIEADFDKFQRLWNYVRRGSAPGNARWANAFAAIRSVVSSTMLGASNALPDAGMAKVYLNAIGLQTDHLVQDMAVGAVPTKENRFRIGQLGLVAESAQAEMRRLGEETFGFGGKTAHFLSHNTYVLSSLRLWDRMMRNGIGCAVMRSLGQWLHKMPEDFTQLDAPSLDYLTRKGVTADHWATWRMAELDKGPDGNAPMLTPDAIENIPDEKLADIATQRVAARSSAIQERISKFNEQTAREHEWLAGRVQKLAEWKSKAQGAIEAARARASVRAGHIEGVTAARAELLRAQIERAEVETDIHRYLTTEAQQGKMAAFMDAVEEGADRERRVIRQRVHPDNKSDAVVENFSSTPAIDERVNQSTQAFAEKVGSHGERLGQRRAQIEAKIADAENRVKDAEQSESERLDAKQADIDKRLANRIKDLSGYADEVRARSKRRADFIAAHKKVLDAQVPQEIANLRREAQVKLLAAIETDMQAAGRGFSGMSAREKIGMRYDLNPAGTFAGEMLRTMAMIRQVPIGIFRTHMIDVPKRFDSRAAGWYYRAKFMAATTILGGIGVQLKNIAFGNEPDDMTKPQFAIKAMLASGGLGLYGDALFNPSQEHDEGMVLKLLGPGATFADDLSKLAGSLRDDPSRAMNDKFQSQLLRTVRNNALPFARLWWLRAAFDHLVYQQAQDYINPGYSQRLRQHMENPPDGQGQRFTWWSPGETTPHRAPDFGAAIGQPSANP